MHEKICTEKKAKRRHRTHKEWQITKVPCFLSVIQLFFLLFLIDPYTMCDMKISPQNELNASTQTCTFYTNEKATDEQRPTASNNKQLYIFYTYCIIVRHACYLRAEDGLRVFVCRRAQQFRNNMYMKKSSCSHKAK